MTRRQDSRPSAIIAPSLLAANFSRLAAEVRRAERAGADWLHLDIMDGHFVPNISFGPAIVKVVRAETRLFLDVHLMCSRPEILLEDFAAAGADRLTVHVELGERVQGLIWKVKALDKSIGLALNPPTPLQSVKPFLRQIDLLLIMTVNPGFGGQSFIKETLPKVQQAAAWREQERLSYHIEVDGGIHPETAEECAGLGANVFVSGTGLFKAPSLCRAIRKMRRGAEGAERGKGRGRDPVKGEFSQDPPRRGR